MNSRLLIAAAMGLLVFGASSAPFLAPVLAQNAEGESAPKHDSAVDEDFDASVRSFVSEQKSALSDVPPPTAVLDAVGQADAATRSVVPPSSSASASPAAASPTIIIERKMPEEVKPGEPFHIELVVHNQGTCAVDKVVVREELAGDVEFVESEPAAAPAGRSVSWSLGAIAAGESKTIRMMSVVKRGSKHTTVTQNATVHFESTVSSTARIAAPDVIIAVSGPEETTVGEPVTYTITVANVGKAAAENVLLHNELPDSLTHPYGPKLENKIGRLGPGETRKVNLTLTPVKHGKISNTIYVAAQDLPTVQQTSVLEVKQIQLEIACTGPKSRYADRACPIVITVSNPSATDVAEVTLEAALSDGLMFVDAAAGGAYDKDTHVIRWIIGSLKGGETRPIPVTVTGSAVGPQAIELGVSAASGAFAEDHFALEIKGLVALDVELRGPKKPTEVGQEATYEIVAKNLGSGAAQNVSLEVNIPSDLEVTSTVGPAGQNAPAGSKFSIPKLAPGESAAYKIVAVAKTPGQRRLRATLSADDLAQPIAAEESTVFFTDEE